MAASRYQLRRTGPVRNVLPSLELISLDQDCVKFGRNPDVVSVVLHSSVYANMISREHAEIRRSRLQDGTVAYHLYDRSLNGTYINDYRVDGQILLHPGDVIQFGHINGAAIQPGQPAPQPDAEFAYIFEKVPRSLTQPQSLDAKMAATLFGAGPASAGGRLTGTPTQWPHPYALGATPHPAYFAAGFNPYLSSMAPLLPTQSGPGASFVPSYGGALSSTAGMIQPSVRQQDVGQAAASWLGSHSSLGMTSVHQSQTAAGMVHQYHSQSPVSAAIPTSAAVYHQTHPSSMVPNQMPIVRSTPEQLHLSQQHHQQQQQHHALNELENRLASAQQQAQGHHLSCAVGHESSSIVTCLAGSSVLSSRSLDSTANFISRPSIPFNSERSIQQDRYAGGGQLNPSTYQSVQSQTDVRRSQMATTSVVASPASQKQNLYATTGSPSTASIRHTPIVRETADVSSPANNYCPPVSSTTSETSPATGVLSTSSSGTSRQQRETVVVETPVRTLADTSTSANTNFDGVSTRIPSSQMQPPSEDKKVECDSSVPSPPEDPIRRRSIESNRDQEEDSQILNRDLFKLASAAQSRCLNNADAQEDVFEIPAPTRTNDLRHEKSSSPDSPAESPPPKRSPSPLRTALSSNKTMTSSGGSQRLSGGGSSSAGSIKRRRKTNEVARLLTDLSDSSFMFEVRKKEEEAQMKQKFPSRKMLKRSESSIGDDDSSRNDEDDLVKTESSDGSSCDDDDDDEDLRSKMKSSKTSDKRSPANKREEQNRSKPSVPPTRKRKISNTNVNRGRKNSEMDSYNSDESSDDDSSVNSFSSGGSFRRPTTKRSLPKKRRSSSSKSSIPNVQRRPNKTTRSSKIPRNNLSRQEKFANDVFSDDDEDDDDDDDDDVEIVTKRSRKSFVGSRNRQKKVQKTTPSSTTTTTTNHVRNKDLSVDDDDGVSWNYHDPTQECAAAKSCLKPTDAEVQWVQCDDCTKWYHMPCAGCVYDEVKDDDAAFHCGCT